MKNQLLTAVVVGSALLFGGCATKKYVAKTIDPIRDHVNQVESQTNQQGKQVTQQGEQIAQQGQQITQHGDQLTKHTADLERNQIEIAANKERAISADARAGDALNKSDKNSRDLTELRQIVGNLDDYKPAGSVAIPFKFNNDVLSPQAKQELDKLVANKKTMKRFFIAVEGYTDRVGSVKYNNALSKRRADAVVQYLVAKHDIPVYRIHEIGLGIEKPADEGKGRAANAKNRRVEVTFYNVDQVTASLNQ